MDNVVELLHCNTDYKSRIQANIDRFARELNYGDGDTEMAMQLLCVINDYLMGFEDGDVYQSAIKVRESIFYLNHFMYSE